MAQIISRGFTPSPKDVEEAEAEFQLLTGNFDLIRKNESLILSNRDYFFCTPLFAYCSFPYISGDGPLHIGYLLEGWRHGIFLEPCPDCRAQVLVTAFWGSPLSGSNGWDGICTECLQRKRGNDSVHKPFADRIIYISNLRGKFPFELNEWKEYDGFKFSWAGLVPVRKKVLQKVRTANPLSLAELIEKIKQGVHADNAAPNVSELHQGGIKVKFERG